MVSAIDPTVPVPIEPTTASVRSNFQIAHDEISALQTAVAGGPYLPISGGTLQGDLILASDPSTPLGAATRQYVDGAIGAAVGAYLPLTGGEVTGQLQVDGNVRIGTPVDAGYQLDVAGTVRFGAQLAVGLDTSTSIAASVSINGAVGSQRQLLLRTASLIRWSIIADNTAESGANAGSNLTIGAFNDAGVYSGPVLVANRATRVVTFPGTVANTTIGQDTGITAALYINAPAGFGKQIYFRSASSSRWVIQANAAAESGSNAGSDFSIFRNDDTGTSLGAALSIIRSTGAVTIPGALTLSGGGTFTGTFAGTHTYSGAITFSGSATVAGNLSVTGGSMTVGTNTATQSLLLNGAAGQSRLLRLQTAGVSRWQIHANATAEGGSNAGTDLDIVSYNDAGATLGNPVARIFRASGNATVGGGVDAGFRLDVIGSARFGAISTTALLTNAANDAAAASAGVGLNQFYRNGSVVMQRAA